MRQIYYENLIARTQLWVVFLAVGLVGCFVPLIQVSAAFKLTVYGGLLLGCAGLIKGLFVKRPVAILDEQSMVLRGVRPGTWKLFQCWKVKQVANEDIVSIRLGYIREKQFHGLIQYPPGEPSRNAIFQMFFWLDYLENGRPRSLYYPHLKNIADYQCLVKVLKGRYGTKVETFGL